MNKKMKTPTTLLTLALAAVLLLSGCAPAKPSALSNDQVVAAVTNILTSMEAGDYAGFSRDLGPKLKNAMPETQFTGIATLLMQTSGKYVSCGATPQLSNSQGFAVYRLSCQFELEPVIVTVSIKVGGTQVDGLYFDSTNLRKAVSPGATATP
jgi:hypothetical protein